MEGEKYMIKLIASDLDGTMLWGPDKIVRDESLELIEALLDQGRTFVAASGRQYANQKRLFARIAERIGFICENGSLLMYRGNVLKKFAYDRETGIELMKSILAKDGCEVLLSGVDTCYIQPKEKSFEDHMKYYVKNNVTVVEDICAVEEPFLKISVYNRNGLVRIAHDWDEQFGSRANIAMSDKTWLDTGPLGADKGSALAAMCEMYGIGTDETLAIGDNYNDIPMFCTAGFPVAMEHGPEEVKKFAKETAKDVNDILRKVLEGKYD